MANKTRIRNRPGAFTLDLRNDANDRLAQLVEHYESDLGIRLDKTSVIRLLIKNDHQRLRLKRKKLTVGA